MSDPAKLTAFERHDAFEATDSGYQLTTTVFETTVQTEPDSTVYTVETTVPTLDGATEQDVGPTLAESWQETLTRRLEDAPKATRATLDLEQFRVQREGTQLRIEYAFSRESEDGALEIAKTLGEYVEGTYVEGIVPGYEYQPPVSSLLANASHSGESGTPL